MLDGWYPEFVHIHIFVGIHETIKNNRQYLKHEIFFKISSFELKEHSIQNHPISDLFRKALRLDESRLPSSFIDSSYLKNVQK